MAALTPKGALTNRERLWATMRELKVFTARELAIGAGFEAGSARTLLREYLGGLVIAGILRLEACEKGKPSLYALNRDMGVQAPRVRRDGTILPDSGRTRMWTTMPILKVFTALELAAAASLDEAPISPAEAESYCGWLARGGYLRRSGKAWQYIAARHTGPKAPQILRVKKLYDPNADKVVTESNPEGRDDE